MSDSDISKQDLFTFIINEKMSPSVLEIKKSFKVYCECQTQSIHDIYTKLKNIENIDLLSTVKIGSDMIHHVFWTTFSFTYNLKLTMFLTERAILLYTEFITMSRNPMLNKDLSFIPNINDAVQFAYKKTIGPIKHEKKTATYRKLINIVKTAAIDIKFILQYIVGYLIDKYFERDPLSENMNYLKKCSLFPKDNDMIILLDDTSLILASTIYKLYQSTNCKCMIFHKLLKIYEDIETDNLLLKIVISKIYIEKYLIIMEKHKKNSSGYIAELNDKIGKFADECLQTPAYLLINSLKDYKAITNKKIYKTFVKTLSD